MDNRYALGLLGKGYEKSGGWRFGEGSAPLGMTPEEAYNEELLNKVGNAGMVSKALEAKPISTAVATGLLGDSGGGGSGNSSMGSTGPTSTGKASDAWGMNQYGYDVNFNAKDAMKGFATLGSPLGALMGFGVSKDPLGQFAYQALVAQEARDMAYQNPQASGYQGFGGGLSQSSIDAANASPDPIGSIAESLGMGGSGSDSSSGYGNVGNGSYGGDTGGYGGSYGSGSVGGFGGSDSSNDGAGGYGGSDNGYYKGGAVTRDRLHGPNPKGPDDGYAALKDGEYVIKASSVKKYGKGLLADINSGKYKG